MCHCQSVWGSGGDGLVWENIYWPFFYRVQPFLHYWSSTLGIFIVIGGGYSDEGMAVKVPVYDIMMKKEEKQSSGPAAWEGGKQN